MRLRRWVGDFIRKHNSLDVEQVSILIEGASSNFVSLKIAHVSDVHIPRSAFSAREIASAVSEQRPDVIFLTGDLMDGRTRFDGPKIALLISKLLKIAPVYAVSGNHERKNDKYYRILKTMLELRGVHFIDDKVMRFKKEGTTFVIAGIKDISSSEVDAADFKFLRDIEQGDDMCYLLLHHKPHLWRSYYPSDALIPDVVFSGHAHGGQVRIPFVKRGLIAPHQGLFPKYISGLYTYSDGSREVVSRGLASSTNPVRVNNKPHLPIITLTAKG